MPKNSTKLRKNNDNLIIPLPSEEAEPELLRKKGNTKKSKEESTEKNTSTIYDLLTNQDEGKPLQVMLVSSRVQDSTEQTQTSKYFKNSPKEIFVADSTGLLRGILFPESEEDQHLLEKLKSIPVTTVILIKGATIQRNLNNKFLQKYTHYRVGAELNLSGLTIEEHFDQSPIWIRLLTLRQLPDNTRVNILGQVKSVSSLQQKREFKLIHLYLSEGNENIKATFWKDQAEEISKARQDLTGQVCVLRNVLFQRYNGEMQVSVNRTHQPAPSASFQTEQDSSVQNIRKLFQELPHIPEVEKPETENPNNNCGCLEKIKEIQEELTILKQKLSEILER